MEFRVTSDRREGLLLALGQVVIASGFSLVRQRMLTTGEGVVLTLVVRGPEDRLLQLEENLGSHPLVRSFEAAANDGHADSPFVPASAPPLHAATPRAPPAATGNPLDNPRIEAMLPQLARDYPNILLHLRAFEHELAPEHRELTLRYIGHRVGAWVYKRDFALGGRLVLSDALRHIALPAMRQVVKAELQGDALQVLNSPFCQHRGGSAPCCHFLRGMLVGLLAETHGGEQLRVVETRCRSAGADACHFEFLS